MDQMPTFRDFINNNRENERNARLVSGIQELAYAQRESNNILKKQCDALQKRNEMLAKDLKDSQRENKRSMIFNIITSSIAFASLIATLLISLL